MARLEYQQADKTAIRLPVRATSALPAATQFAYRGPPLDRYHNSIVHELLAPARGASDRDHHRRGGIDRDCRFSKSIGRLDPRGLCRMAGPLRLCRRITRWLPRLRGGSIRIRLPRQR